MPQGLGVPHLIESHIRFADPLDVPRILVLAEMAWDGSPRYGAAGLKPDVERWEDIAFACVSRGCAVVAEVDGVVVGVILGCEEEDYGTGETAVIDLLTYVSPGYRHGDTTMVASMIVLMEQWGREHDLDWCRLGSRSGYRPSALAVFLKGLGYARMPFVDCWKRLK